MVRAEGADSPPYGQTDRKIFVFYDSPYLGKNLKIEGNHPATISKDQIWFCRWEILKSLSIWITSLNHFLKFYKGLLNWELSLLEMALLMAYLQSWKSLLTNSLPFDIVTKSTTFTWIDYETELIWLSKCYVFLEFFALYVCQNTAPTGWPVVIRKTVDVEDLNL